MGTLVNYATDKGIALVTLSDPPVNACTHEMFKELDAAILDARFDGDVHVVVITGAGERCFSAGANIKMLREVDETFTYYFFLHASETLRRIEGTPKLCIAALNGHAIGTGLEIALACDLRVARSGPYVVGFPEVELGLLPGAGGTQRLPELIGKGRAIELLVSGRKLGLDEAEKIGLLTHVWKADTYEAFIRQVLDYARGFTPPSRSSGAIGRIKRAGQGEAALGSRIALEQELLRDLAASSDAREGLQAFVQKRPPTFRAR